jgi:RNA 2',3'-cyclic 3'-phosphodiesterase
MRMFLAINLPDEVLSHLQRLQEMIKEQVPKLSLTRLDQLHITLKFLGDVDPRQVRELTDSLLNVRASAAIELHAARLACFPDPGPVRIVAAEMEGDLGALKSVHAAIEQRCKFLGFDREGRAYRPHVTIGRARPTLPSSTRDIVRDLEVPLPGPKFTFSEYFLYESKLSPQGSQYRKVERFSLL